MIRAAFIIVILATVLGSAIVYFKEQSKCFYKGEDNLDGKFILVTGANAGIGFETSLEMSRKGANVILVCRNETRCNTAVERIQKLLQDFKHKGTLDVVLMDLNSLQSVVDGVKKLRQKFTKLDILINNAGISTYSAKYTLDHFESHFGVNHLSHFLLTHLLLPLLNKSSAPRVVTVSSEMYRMMNYFGTFEIDKPGNNVNHSMFGYGLAYAESKLANILFAKELSRRYSNILSVSLHPGAVDTEIFHFPFSILEMLAPYIKPLILLTPIEGAQTSIHCALSSDVTQNNGGYYSSCRPVQPSGSLVNNATLAKLFFDKSLQLVKPFLN